ncbi:MAG: nitroreductase family deazaflavin-dependent oxidoreductase [Acidimicrobiia bacterium]
MFAKLLLAIVGVVAVGWVVETALMVWAWRSRNPRALRLIKRFNKYVTNPLMLRVPGRSGTTAIVHHVGRRSGKPYATPVIAHQSHHGVIIPLPYGTEVDWLHNLQAAGQAVVDLEGRTLTVDEPAVVDIDDVISLLPAPMARTVRFNGAREAVLLHVSVPAALASA